MNDSFSKRMGELLSDVLETGEVPKAQYFSANGDTSASRNFSASGSTSASGDASASAEYSASGDASASAKSSASGAASANGDSSASADFYASGDASTSTESSTNGGESVDRDFSTGKRRPRFNFSKEQIHTAQIIRQGGYTEIPQEVIAAFALLGCPVTSMPAEVRRTFRAKIKKLHPDSASQNYENATAESEKLISANETIKNWFIQKGI